MTIIDPQVRARIYNELFQIEKKHGVLIPLAVESGSRAWGFASTDSDYDVRFIYVRKRDWYLSIDEGRDVIELPIDDVLDINGWDIKKALKLLRKSNPALIEWFASPIVYTEQRDTTAFLRSLVSQFYSPRAAFFHYGAMAHNNWKKYLSGETVWRKKYFYVLRPVLAMHWIEQNMGMVPVEFDVLVKKTMPGPMMPMLEQLLADKRAGKEMDHGPRNEVLSKFLEGEMARLDLIGHTIPVGNPPDDDVLDKTFRSILYSVW